MLLSLFSRRILQQIYQQISDFFLYFCGVFLDVELQLFLDVARKSLMLFLFDLFDLRDVFGNVSDLMMTTVDI